MQKYKKFPKHATCFHLFQCKENQISASDSKKSIEFCIKHNFYYGIGDFTIITNKILSIFLYLCNIEYKSTTDMTKDINRIKVVLVEGSDVMYIKMPK